MPRLFLALVGVLLLTGVVNAQSYCGRSCYAAPSYSYYPTYYPVYQDRIIYKEVQVPYAKPVFINRDYYFSVGDYYRDAQRDDVLASAAAYKALLLQTQMAAAAGTQVVQAAQQAAYNGYSGFSVAPGARLMPGPAAGSVAAPGGSGGPPVRPQGVAPEGTGGGPLVIPPRLAKIIDEKCVVCHQGQPRRYDFTDLRKLTAEQWAMTFFKVHTNKMPKPMKGKPFEALSDAEVKEFADFAERLAPSPTADDKKGGE